MYRNFAPSQLSRLRLPPFSYSTLAWTVRLLLEEHLFFKTKILVTIRIKGFEKILLDFTLETTSRNGKSGRSIASIACIIGVAFSYTIRIPTRARQRYTHTRRSEWRSHLDTDTRLWYAAKKENEPIITHSPWNARGRTCACLPLLPRTVHRPWYDIDARHRSINRLRNKRGRKSRGALVVRL